RVEGGMRARAQNVWPSLRFDVKAANRVLAAGLGPGFYYKTFMWPRPLWPLYAGVLRRFAPGGRTTWRPGDGYYDQRHVHADVVIAGGGPAGMSAALAAAAIGARVLLVEEEYEPGGHLRWRDQK